jgi:non-ribosomal peptide synthetase component F/thioesterase domain-containing protein
MHEQTIIEDFEPRAPRGSSVELRGAPVPGYDRRRDHDPTPWIRLFRAHAAAQPGAPALVGGDRALTYGEVDARSDQIAGCLSRLALPPGAVVATYFSRTNPDAWCWTVGVLKAGLCLYTLEPTVGAELLCQRLGAPEVEARLVVAEDPAFAEVVRQRLPALPLAAPDAPGPHEVAPVDPSNARTPALLLQSSGTTGRPKVMRVPRQNLANLAAGGREAMGMSNTSRLLQISRCVFDATAFEWLCIFGNGGALVLLPDAAMFEPRALLAQILEQEVTHIIMTPTHCAAFMAGLGAIQRQVLLTSLEHLNLVGEATPAVLLDELIRLGAARISNGYGPTEAGICVSLAPMWQGGRRYEPRLGWPIAGDALRIGVQEGDRWILHTPETEGLLGQLFVANEIEDVYASEDLNRARYVRVWDPAVEARVAYFNTGDLVRVRVGAEGPTLEFVGRADNQVKVAGQLVATEEVELALAELLTEGAGAGAHQVHVRPEGGGEVPVSLTCFITARDQASADLRVRALGEAARGRLEAYKLPTRFRWVPAFPIKSGGKIDSARLLAEALPAGPGGTSTARVSAPVSLEEARLLQLLGALVPDLARVPPGLDMKVADVVLNSLDVMTLQVRLREAMGVTLDVIDLRGMTLREVAALIGRQAQADGPARLMARMQVGSPEYPPLFLLPPGDGASLVYVPLVAALGPERPVYGLRCPGSEPWEPLSRHTVEDYAALWREELVAAYPEGPVQLGGFCFGGLVAWELARQLRDQGRQVSLLAMLDSPDPGQTVPVDEDPVVLSELFASMFECTLPPAALRAVGPEQAEQLAALLAHGQREGRLPPGLDVARVARIIAMEKLTGATVPAYVPPALDLDIVFFRATPTARMRWTPAPERGWAPVARRLEVLDFESNHLEMMKAPFVSDVALQLRARLLPPA